MKIKSAVSRNGSPRRRRFSPDQIEEFLAEFERGDLSAATFAREHRLCYSAFCRWRSQRQRRPPRTPPPRFEPLPLGSLLGSSVWAAEIAWPEGPTLRLQERAATAWVRELIEALRRPC